MKTLLVLTDFSPAAIAAADYACEFAKQLTIPRIVLYHSYRSPVAVSEAVMLLMHEEENRLQALKNLEALVQKLRKRNPVGIEFSYRADELGLEEIDTVAVEETAIMLVMGTTGKTKLEEVLLGSNAITVCRESNLPVVLVPDHVIIQPVRKIILACDMIEVQKTIPVNKLKSVLDTFKVPVTILNVDNEDKRFTSDTPLNTMLLDEMLKNYKPEYYNINSRDVAQGIIEFTKLNSATIVLLISRKHNFFEGIFYNSLTRKLAHMAPFPLMILHGLEY